MIDVYKTDGALTFQIGPHEFPVTLEEAAQLREMIINDGIEGLQEEDWTFGPWRMECAGAYEHPWETRQRVILHYGKKKWHLTLFEAETLADKFGNLLGE